MPGENRQRRARTVLEELIWARQMTFEEFVEYAESFAQEHGQPGTLSLRHLHRLASGQRTGRPALPTTRRLLEAIFDVPWAVLLGEPGGSRAEARSGEAGRLSILVRNARRLDLETVKLCAGQIDTIRQLDRRFGAATLLEQLRQHAANVHQLATYTVDPRLRRALAAVLTDAHTLCGWQSLDLGETVAAWNHYRDACEAARIAESAVLLAHAQAEQAVVLADAGETAMASELAAHACAESHRCAPALLRAWLAAAHGEALAAHGQETASLRAFDEAARLLPAESAPEPESPYIALNDTHLARWRGHAMARFGHPDAVEVLTEALAHHDRTFVRAESGLRVDLALAHAACGERDQARVYRDQARELAGAVGSARQLGRLACFTV